MAEYSVEPKSREDLRNIADILREYLDLKNVRYIPIVELLDVLSLILEDFNYEIVHDNVLGKDIHAETDIRTGHIRIKESVYIRACSGEGRDRMTIAHELGHYFTLCFCGFKLQRNFSGTNVSPCRDPEWQAKCFAGEFMIPAKLVKNMSIEEIANKCGVSYDAARYQYNKLRK